ncbi:MAG: hypothetical protein AB1714_07350 [Acidobacteriota bacterium]
MAEKKQSRVKRQSQWTGRDFKFASSRDPITKKLCLWFRVDPTITWEKWMVAWDYVKKIRDKAARRPTAPVRGAIPILCDYMLSLHVQGRSYRSIADHFDGWLEQSEREEDSDEPLTREAILRSLKVTERGWARMGPDEKARLVRERIRYLKKKLR